MDQKSPEAFRTISEVADWLGVPTHVLRFWESRFSQVKPVKRAGGRRYYRPADMELLGGIRKLLHEDGMTIRGVQKLLREKGVKHVAAMSPSLELSTETRDVTPDNVVDLADRREERGSADAVEEAETIAENGEDDRRFPFDDEPMPAPQDAGSEAGTVDEAAAVEEPLTVAAGSDADLATEAVDEAAAEVETTAGPEADEALPAPDEMAFLSHEAAPEAFEAESIAVAEGDEPAEPVIDPTDPMSSPEALTFAAHDAEPDVSEGAEAATEERPESPADMDAGEEDQDHAPEPVAESSAVAEGNEPAELVTDPTDPMSSPEALAFAAHDAEPDLSEGAEAATEEKRDAPAEKDETEAVTGSDQGQEPEPEAESEADETREAEVSAKTDAETAPEAEPEAEPQPEAEPAPPALVMPLIDDDPDDDDREAGALMATELRALRRSRSEVNIAALQALADRLDEITRRIADDGGPHRSL